MEEREGIRRVWFDQGHKILRQVLCDWIAMLDRLAFEWREDPDYPWWYNGRTLVSTLAAAVWRAGNSAFEEHSVEKRSVGRDSSSRIETAPS